MDPKENVITETLYHKILHQ